MKSLIQKVTVGAVFSSTLFLAATSPAEGLNPPPPDASWSLLSDNSNEGEAEKVIYTDVTYVCEPKPNHMPDIDGPLPEGTTVEEMEASNPGRLLLDNTSNGLGWATRETDDVTVTFDLKNEYLVERIDIFIAGWPKEWVPQRISFSMSVPGAKSGEENLVEALPAEEIDPEAEPPMWVSSSFAPRKARFVRLSFTGKENRQWFIIGEVRIWGKAGG